MQKRAARRGTRALAFLLCLLMVVTLLPAMGANAAGNLVTPEEREEIEQSGGLVLDKNLYLQSDGTYTLKLEAYATGTTTTQTIKNGTPLDIVLVIDQSGSMAYNDNGNSTNTASDRRMEKLKAAAKSFVESISADAKEYDLDHRIALVGYANGASKGNLDTPSGYGWNGSNQYWINTGLYVNGSFKNYQSNVQTNYWGEVTSATDLTAQDYKAALVSVNTNGNVTSSITTAIDSFKAWGGTYTEYGLTMAQKVFANNSANYTKTDGTTGTRKRIVVLFTDGETNSDISTVLEKANALKGNSYGATIYCVGFGSSVNTDFLGHVSSNYKTASYDWVSTGWFGGGEYRYSGTQVSTKYSMAASNRDELTKIFDGIATDVQNPSTEVKLNADAVLKDVISDDFTTTTGTTVAVSTEKGSQANKDADIVFNGAGDSKPTAALKDNTVTVTGFDYSSKYIAPSHDGEKLIVVIDKLIPNTNKTNHVYSNGEAGIYENSDATEPVATFQQPYINITEVTKVLDFSMTAKIASSVLQMSKKSNTYGTFTVGQDKNLTYELGNSVANGNLVFDGVDSALFYGDYNDGSTDTTARWTKVNVIPANNVYYDDDLLNSSSTFTDGDYGYDENVPSTTETTAVTGGTSKTFTFTGTGIDVYCTTEITSGWVTARLSKMVDGVDTYVDGAIMKNEYVSEPCLYNVPTLSFTGLDYGTYTLTINTDNNSNYKLDGVRIYNPAQGNSDVTNKYAVDESNAVFTQVRQILLNDQKAFSVDDTVAGAVYVDEQHEGATLEKYEKEGPKNEVYLNAGDAIAFKVDGYQDGMKVMVGLSAPAKGQNAGQVTMSSGNAKAPTAVNSAVDMYYNVTPNADGCVVIKNTGNSLISVTNVKVSGAGASSASFEVSPQLMSYVEGFDTLSIAESETPATPDPTPATPNNTVSAIIHAIWSSVRDSIGRLFGR